MQQAVECGDACEDEVEERCTGDALESLRTEEEVRSSHIWLIAHGAHWQHSSAFDHAELIDMIAC